jgi:hypothetical protein
MGSGAGRGAREEGQLEKQLSLRCLLQLSWCHADSLCCSVSSATSLPQTKTDKSTALTSDGSGASGSNAFQVVADARQVQRTNERAGISTPTHGNAGSEKKRGAHRNFKQKGFKSHKERNAEKKGPGKGRPKGPRDFTA